MSERDPDDNCLGQDLSNKENYGKQWENAEEANGMCLPFRTLPFQNSGEVKRNLLPH